LGASQNLLLQEIRKALKKILFYINAIHYGGAEKVLVNLANEFAAIGYRTIVVTSFYDSPEYALSGKVKRYSLEQEEQQQSFLRRNMLRIIRLRRICRKEKPDLVVSFMGEANFRAIIATLFLPMKTMISVRNDPDKEYGNRFLRLLAKVFFRLADGCVFQTEEARNWFPKGIRYKSKIILNQVDANFYKVNYTGERKHIVTVGRLEPQKNHKLLLRAFQKIANRYPEEKLLLYGEGTLYRELSDYINKLGLHNRVQLKGATMDIPNRIYSAKLFVLSSDYEGLPNAVMEAMALGIPVVSTDCPCGGPRLLIRNKETGILVPVKNAKAMARAMDMVLSDNALYEKLSCNARIRAKEFEPEAVFKEWKAYIDEVIQG
jgi:glycosyltransferase involved in cell wall biosynthesis